MKSLAMIPVKNNSKTGKYRLSTQAIFNQKIYGQRNLVETVNSVEKRIFDGKKHQQKYNIKKQRNQSQKHAIQHIQNTNHNRKRTKNKQQNQTKRNRHNNSNKTKNKHHKKSNTRNNQQ